MKTKIDGKPLVYFDNAASTQKPKQVINAIKDFYSNNYANIHRGNHYLSRKATEAYENSRTEIARFINASQDEEIIFVKGTTEGINLVAYSWGLENLKKGDEILLTMMEHHANIVPWQLVALKTGAVVKVVPITQEGNLDLIGFDNMLNPRTRLVAFTHVSNTLGTINPAKELIAKAHAVNAITLVDGAQSTPHLPIDVQDLDCDFFVFSGHKMYGPTGIGVLYGKMNLLSAMTPYQGGGDMIEHVSFEKTTFKPPPARFEAGTPHIEGAIGLAAAAAYLQAQGREKLHNYECELLDYAIKSMKKIDGLQIVGEPAKRASAISFHMPTAHHQDIADILDAEGIAVRTGHHCCEPLMHELGLSGTARASLTFYNTKKEVNIFINALKKAKRMLE